MGLDVWNKIHRNTLDKDARCVSCMGENHWTKKLLQFHVVMVFIAKRALAFKNVQFVKMK